MSLFLGAPLTRPFWTRMDTLLAVSLVVPVICLPLSYLWFNEFEEEQKKKNCAEIQ